MSSALAIASVSYILKDMLNDGMIENGVSGIVGGDVIVSALPPDRIDISETNSENRLNLFMYQTVPNTGWRNVGFPSRNSRGERISNPPLALNLNYLMTAYGAEELYAEILLGYGMQLLYESPVFGRDAIRTMLSPGNLPPELIALSTSELDEQIEQIKVTPHLLSTEELSKIWTTFESKYRPTASYQVSVVLIESKKSTKTALPVREGLVYVVPFNQPVIEKIMSQSADDEPIIENQKILEGFNLVLQGRQLQGDITLINVSGIEVTPDDENTGNNQIIFTLPPGLKAGIQGVQVIHQKWMGSPPEPHRGVQSNAEPFVLSPRIDNLSVSNIQGTGNDPRSADIELEIAPEIHESQKVILLLNEFAAGPVSDPLKAYSFQAAGLTSPSANITIPVTDVKAGEYLVRVMIDGADSPLQADATGKYNAPKITIA